MSNSPSGKKAITYLLSVGALVVVFLAGTGTGI